jgi:hypothetical protein
MEPQQPLAGNSSALRIAQARVGKRPVIELAQPEGAGYPAGSIYHFDFEPLDAPGPRSLGRMEWSIELFRSKKTRQRYLIDGLLVWGHQTRDPRYLGHAFWIPCFVEKWTASPLVREGDFTKEIWCLGYCQDHGYAVLTAYAQNEHHRLTINASSSICLEVRFG